MYITIYVLEKEAEEGSKAWVTWKTKRRDSTSRLHGYVMDTDTTPAIYNSAKRTTLPQHTETPYDRTVVEQSWQRTEVNKAMS